MNPKSATAWLTRFRPRPAGWLANLGRGVLDLLYPPMCPGCDAVALEADATGRREPVCPACELRLEPLAGPFCKVCGQAFESGGARPFRCANCGGRKFDFEFAIAPFLARGLLRDMVHRFKFGRVSQMRRPLGVLFARVFDDPRLAGTDWILVPVPIHPRRQRHRTFNQSAELAAILAEETGFPVVQALKRVKFTPPQSRLNREQRLENLAAAIVPVPKPMAALAGRDVLLVDDIFTTGSTGQACASVLRANGARKVVVITLGRG